VLPERHLDVEAAFRRGRDFGAWVGIVPRQYSTGGKLNCLIAMFHWTPNIRRERIFVCCLQTFSNGTDMGDRQALVIQAAMAILTGYALRV